MSIFRPLAVRLAPITTLPLALVAVALAGWVAPAQVPRAHDVPLRVPDGFTVERVAGPDLLAYPMFAIVAGDGQLFVFESTAANTMTTEEMLAAPAYQVRLLEDVDGDGIYDRSHVFADRIPFPMGGVLLEGSLYVAAAPDLLRLTDTTGDGRADQREVVLTGWTLNVNGAAMGGPYMGPDGWFYITDARRGFEITRKEGDVLQGKGARIWRVRPDGSGLEWIAGGGFDNAVEIAFMPSGETIGTMTYFVEPLHGLRDALMHWVEGGVYPKPHPVIDEDRLPRTGELMPPMTQLARVAPSGLLRYRGASWGEAWRGNLFSAQFNTGRVMRHIVVPDGATYRTEDSSFVTATRDDVHPTDVVEDADGSLLVLDTGGWFIKGCPLSRVAKPDVEGAIYRVRKIDARPVPDPWGHALDVETLAPERLVAALADARPMVVDQAVMRLVALGAEALPALTATVASMDDAEARTAAVFALHRIGTPDAHAAVRRALGDAHPHVRTAAARAVGLARDTAALGALQALVSRDSAPQVRRQAATALGQLATAGDGASGRSAATTALLGAAALPSDRVLEHAIIHALIAGADRPQLVEALDHASVRVRKAALIALDQVPDSPLRREHVAPLLTADADELVDAALWVLAHRPAWTGLVVDLIGQRLDAAATVPAAVDEASRLALTFCRDQGVQSLVANRLLAASGSDTLRGALLDVMASCSLTDLPDPWVAATRQVLGSSSIATRSRALRFVETRAITAMEADVARVATDTTLPDSLRLDALAALVRLQPTLPAPHVAFLLERFGPAYDAPVRQRAARILGQATLTEPELVGLADTYVGTADVTLLPRLLDPFVGGTSEAVGLALVRALLAARDRLDTLPDDDLTHLFASYPPAVQEAAEPVLAALRQRLAERLARLEDLEQRLARGSVDAGRALFFGDSLCSTCHAVGEAGGTFGPDLTTIGDIRSRHDILEAILFPSASLAREYETYRVTTASATYTGIIKEQDEQVVVIDTGPDARIRLPRAEVQGIEPLTVSAMPPGLDQVLTIEEFSDLMAFLESLPDPIDRPSRQGESR
jgi:putative membrane-bound dehydrogenase-like protein